jgi:predicted phosphoribosyltransferase
MVVVAVPVGAPKAIVELRKKADELICLHVPDNFYAVGQFYEDFSPVSDDDVIYLMKKTHSKKEPVH